MNHYNTSLDFISHEAKQKLKQRKQLKIHFSGRRFLRRVFKTLTVFILIFSLQIPYSLSFFWDSEISTGNVFAAGKLDMSFTSLQTNFSPAGIIKGKTATMSAKIINLTGLPFKYKLGISELDPTNELCNNLSLKVWYYRYSAPSLLGKTLKYSGSLTGFQLNSDGADSVMRIGNDQPYIANSEYSDKEHWYWYEVTLPTNADPSLGSRVCNFNLISEAVQTNMNFGTGFWDSETLTASISTSSWAKVSGMKWNDLNKNGFKDGTESGIPNWSIFAGKQFEQFNVNSNGSGMESKILENGKKYVVRATGTIQASSDLRTDAKYASQNPYINWTDTIPGYEGNGAQFLELKIDNNVPEWGSYQSDHEYWTTITGSGNKLTFSINNQVLPNNSGSLQVTIFETVAEDVTDAQGLYEIDLSNLSGQFIVGEEQKTGWIQTYPTKGLYTFTSPAIYVNKDFGNVEVPPTPDIDKIVINEVYYDVKDDGSKGNENKNEWVELYNPTDHDISIKGWTLDDNSGENGINGNPTIPSHGFAVLSHDNSTWVQYWDSYGAITAGVEGSQAWLNNDGDQLTLKNKNGVTIDFVAWEGGYSNANPTWTANATQGKSIARKTLGVDTDQPSDWGVLDAPNPGTNPHSHIQVNLNQEGNNLILGFSNAFGFDLVKYLITYSHLYQGTYIQEAIEGQKGKSLDELQLLLKPFYLGTCSSLGEVCVAHTDIKDLNLKLEYYDADNTLGTSEILYNWKN